MYLAWNSPSILYLSGNSSIPQFTRLRRAPVRWVVGVAAGPPRPPPTSPRLRSALGAEESKAPSEGLHLSVILQHDVPDDNTEFCGYFLAFPDNLFCISFCWGSCRGAERSAHLL